MQWGQPRAVDLAYYSGILPEGRLLNVRFSLLKIHSRQPPEGDNRVFELPMSMFQITDSKRLSSFFCHSGAERMPNEGKRRQQ